MWENKFDEKEYKSMKYVDCYCSKHAKVLVGMKLYPYVNTLGALCVILALALFLQPDIPIFAKLAALGVFGIILTLAVSIYRAGRRMMQNAGHSKECGKKIGRLVMLYAGTYSPYTIMKGKK